MAKFDTAIGILQMRLRSMRKITGTDAAFPVTEDREKETVNNMKLQINDIDAAIQLLQEWSNKETTATISVEDRSGITFEETANHFDRMT